MQYRAGDKHSQIEHICQKVAIEMTDLVRITSSEEGGGCVWEEPGTDHEGAARNGSQGNGEAPAPGVDVLRARIHPLCYDHSKTDCCLHAERPKLSMMFAVLACVVTVPDVILQLQYAWIASWRHYPLWAGGENCEVQV